MSSNSPDRPTEVPAPPTTEFPAAPPDEATHVEVDAIAERHPTDTERPPPALDSPTEPHMEVSPAWVDPEATINLTGDVFFPSVRDDASAAEAADSEAPDPQSVATQVYPVHGGNEVVPGEVASAHLRGLLEALVFVSDKPIKVAELAKATAASTKEVRDLLAALKDEYAPRGIQLDEVAGGWLFRTSAAYAPFVRDMTKQKPIKLTRAQVETLAILAYRQPITRPEIDEIRGVDSGPVLKLLLERDLVRILGKKDEPGRPLLYGTTPTFLEFFGLKSLRDLPTLREFTELNEDSRRVVERELGDVLDARQEDLGPPAQEGEARDTLVPGEYAAEEARNGAQRAAPAVPLPDDDDATALFEGDDEPAPGDGDERAPGDGDEPAHGEGDEPAHGEGDDDETAPGEGDDDETAHGEGDDDETAPPIDGDDDEPAPPIDGDDDDETAPPIDGDDDAS